MKPRRVSAWEGLARETARAACRENARRILFLDLDGTLAPIAPTPARARVPGTVLDSLRSLTRNGWRICIVSGRPLREARKLVPVEGVGFFGSHGLEGPLGRTAFQRSKINEAIRRLKGIQGAARALARRFAGAILESKPAGLAFHHRNVAPEQMARWRRERDRLLADADLTGIERLRGKRVLELRPAGVDKGEVILSVLRRAGSRGKDGSIVAVGDDATDEDMFRAVRGRGVGVRVGKGGVRTSATRRLPSPGAVRRFLAELARRDESRS